jgi:hypothetical protein
MVISLCETGAASPAALNRHDGGKGEDMDKDWSAHFRPISRRWVDDALAPKISEIPEIVYHYTDAAGLIGMLRSNRIWATDYRFLNDQSEIAHTQAITLEIIEQREKTCRNSALKQLYSEVREYQGMAPESDIFVFSLSEERDDLSQWRGYARDGMGFTVGFSGPALFQESLSSDEFGFLAMEYDHAKQRRTLLNALSDIAREVRKQIKESTAELDYIIDAAAVEFDFLANECAACNKHKSFSSEKEWRIVDYIYEENKDIEVKTRVSGHRLINYIEIGSDLSKLPIVEIGIGPGFAGLDQHAAVEALCRETRRAPQIYSADTPYRRV